MTFFVIRLADGRFYSKLAGAVNRSENADLFATKKQAKQTIKTHKLQATIIRVTIGIGD